MVQVLEESIQDVMHTAVNGRLPTAYHENLFKFLGVFHTKRTDLRVNAMMFQNYEPILWRGLKVNAFPILSYNTITRSAISDLAQSVCIAA